MIDQRTIGLVTSIVPRLSRRDAGMDVGESYQHSCIMSWIESGFCVFSLNHRDEIVTLGSKYPKVTFVATHRDASPICGRRNPLLADLLGLLASLPCEIVGIVNSDVYAELSPRWLPTIASHVPDSIVAARRYDYESASSTSNMEGGGFDCFFFRRADLGGILQRCPAMAIGLPWWDYYLPVAVALQGKGIRLIQSPVVVHLAHETAWNPHSFVDQGLRFISFVQWASARSATLIPPGFKQIIQLCRNYLIRPKLDSEDIERLRVFAVECHQQIMNNAMYVP